VRASSTARSVELETSVTAETGSADVVFSTGRIARLASGAVTAQIGNSVVLATAVTDPYMTEKSFMALTVDFRTKNAAMGIIPGNLFRKEMGTGDSDILSARVVDRSLRPLFPEGYHYESQIITTLQSFDPQHSDVDVQSINAASTALCVSDIPFNGPVAAIRIARSKDGSVVKNPTLNFLESEECVGNLLYAGTEFRPIMLEGEMLEWSESEIIEIMELAHSEIQSLLAAQKELQSKAGKSKRSFTPCVPDEKVMTMAHEIGYQRAAEVVTSDKGQSKEDRGVLQTEFYAWMREQLTVGLDQETADKIGRGTLHTAAERVMKAAVRNSALLDDPVRFDGRPKDQVRQILLDADVLPVVHGSALFSRGDTQTLCTSTLGGVTDSLQLVRGIEADSARAEGKDKIRKNFFLQYEFPPYSVNEVGRVGGVNRRMVGHGTLAEKALAAVIPSIQVPTLNAAVKKLDEEGIFDFNYTVRVTSEVSSSDGSSSMATVCGATAALQDAGVPLKAPVAGVSIGLMTPAEGTNWEMTDKYQLLTDILGAEDHFGDMDFKIAGTDQGVTALQLDMKQHGIPIPILSEALDAAKVARHGILRTMSKSMRMIHQEGVPKTNVQRRVVFELDDPSQMGVLIGTKGATIRGLESKFPGCSVTTGNGSLNNIVEVAGKKIEIIEACVRHIHGMFVPLLVGVTYTGVVSRMEGFGAFVDLDEANHTVLVHVSELDHGFVKDPNTICSIGDSITVKCVAYDQRSERYRFSRKATLEVPSVITKVEESEGKGERLMKKSRPIESTTVTKHENNAVHSLSTDQELYEFIVKDERAETFDRLSPEALTMLSGLADATSVGAASVVDSENGGSESITSVDKKSGPRREPVPGQSYMGQVVSVRSYGAFVDIGCNRHGMIHVSELGDEAAAWVESAAAKLSPGDIIKVDIAGVTKSGNIYLTQRIDGSAVSDKGSSTILEGGSGADEGRAGKERVAKVQGAASDGSGRSGGRRSGGRRSGGGRGGSGRGGGGRGGGGRGGGGRGGGGRGGGGRGGESRRAGDGDGERSGGRRKMADDKERSRNATSAKSPPLPRPLPRKTKDETTLEKQETGGGFFSMLFGKK